METEKSLKLSSPKSSHGYITLKSKSSVKSSIFCQIKMQDIKTEIESHLRSDLLLVILPPMTLFTDNGRLNEKNINSKKRFRLHHISPEFI